MKEFKIIDFNNELVEVNEEITNSISNISKVILSEAKTENELNNLLKRVKVLAKKSNLELEEIDEVNKDLERFDLQINKYLYENSDCVDDKFKKFPELSNLEIIISELTGIASILIDVLGVGIPRITRNDKGQECFEGSWLTKWLREIGRDNNGKIEPILKWFSDKCKVPYDISAYKDTVIPNNHRLRSFAHDPLFGLLFAVEDIILGTTTCIDNNGEIKILLNKRKASIDKKLGAVIYYFGHLISDVCTACGLPIPGFCVTQFFQAQIGDKKIAQIAEKMYKNGYDLRHMLSMELPVLLKNMLIDAYIFLTQEVQDEVLTIAEREKNNLDNKLKKYKMRFIADTTATVGNTIKFVAPPSCGNPAAINLMQWKSFLQSGMFVLKAGLRDTSVEEAMHLRNVINNSWDELLK